ncbi:hypothetical protein evm_000951 [Chilo suppressalis]|nr:hypothetical protein evm_000951 [Chilo suppressalis]
MTAPLGITAAHDEKKKKDMLENINTVIPDQKMMDILKEPANEGAAYLSDIIKGRGQALQVIHDNLEKKQDKDFINLGKYHKSHVDAAHMLESAAHFGGHTAAPIILNKVNKRITEVAIPDKRTQDYMEDTSHLTSSYLAGIATEEADLNHMDTTSGDDEARRRAEEEAKRRAAARRRAEEEARRRAEEEERRRREAAERASALGILHTQLEARGGENFYKQPHTEMSHAQASKWLKTPPMKVDKVVKECADTDRLHKKFERKLSAVVSKSTPNSMIDVMQDVVIESSRTLSEYFVASNYKALAREGLISEMQKRGNEILVEVNGAAETFFFAAQRLKKATSMEIKEPCTSVAYYIAKKLDEIIKCRSMARKLTSTMKEHIKTAAEYLSELATKPDEQIEAYVTLLAEMESNGDALLIEGNIPKSYKDAAAYLRQLTSWEDQINLPNGSLQSETVRKLKRIMANVTPRGYSTSVLDGVINECAKLLVSYIMLQGEKTKALRILVSRMDASGDGVLLRHGTIRKTYTDGADLLRDKNNDQLRVPNGDPVVARKIHIKLHNLMLAQTPERHAALMEDVIEDATTYLAVHLLQPQLIQVCKCMKNVFVQCELWCDEILRRVARPCCTCSRHVSAQALQDLAPAQRIQISPSSSRAFAPGIEISLTSCPSKVLRTCNRRGENIPECPAAKGAGPCEDNATTSYLLYSAVRDQQASRSRNTLAYSPEAPYIQAKTPSSMEQENLSRQSLLFDVYQTEHAPTCSHRSTDKAEPEHDKQETSDESADMYFTPPNTTTTDQSPFWQSPTTMYTNVITRNNYPSPKSTLGTVSSSAGVSGISSRTPIVTTDQMTDWHAMMVSLMWNVQAWRDWIQECMDHALSYRYEPDISPMESEKRWAKLRERITNEAFQWRQYNNFSRQLTLRLASRYGDKQIVSPTRATVRTATYRDCQSEMLDIINMFYRWTHWLNAVVKETNTLQQVTGSDVPLHVMRWIHFKKKIEEHVDDWNKYKTHLNVYWEHKYQSLISEWLPSWNKPGPVWVVSACGAVPSGAVAAGLCRGEVTWVARTTHKNRVLPAALHPSKHCCTVYADGSVHHYTKYQVMCNAEVTWKPWKAGSIPTDAVKIASKVYAGRVHYHGSHLVGAVHAPAYRCHVIIYDRPFAFNCYDLLVLEANKR